MMYTPWGYFANIKNMRRNEVRKMGCNCHEEENGQPKHRIREQQEKRALMNRLSRIEGQIRGVKSMIEEERYCVDILTQVAAVQAAFNGLTREILASHIKGCVVKDIQDGNEQAVDELCELLKKLMR